MTNHPNRASQLVREQCVHHKPTGRVGIINSIYKQQSGYEYAVAFGNRRAGTAEVEVVPFFDLLGCILPGDGPGSVGEVTAWRQSQGFDA